MTHIERLSLLVQDSPVIDPAPKTTSVPGLLLVNLVVHQDERGWFKENWQREKMEEVGLPDFGPVQQNTAYNAVRGVTRGFHAEPWDKFVTVATGSVFGAWVDLRPGPTFGWTVTQRIDRDTAVFVPRGVANAYQVLQDGTVYSYLVNDHWRADAKHRYRFVNLADPTIGVEWPIPLAEATLSEADRRHPLLEQARPVETPRTLILGSTGQLGKALTAALPDATALGRVQLDLANPHAIDRLDLSDVGVIINAAAYTNVDKAETPQGRRDAWAVNVEGVRRLVEACRRRRVKLVHVSSDYVFDGTAEAHPEDEPFSPLGVYGQTKAAGDALVTGYERHYLIRTSWVVGEGKNFVATMAELADRGVSPSVVDDQCGRLAFAEDLAAAIVHLLTVAAPYGTYNVTNSGPVQSWADIAAEVFALKGREPAEVARVSTAEYAGSRAIAPRPRHSALLLDRIIETGFAPPPMDLRIRNYVNHH